MSYRVIEIMIGNYVRNNRFLVVDCFLLETEIVSRRLEVPDLRTQHVLTVLYYKKKQIKETHLYIQTITTTIT